jgi:hypothetical protein
MQFHKKMWRPRQVKAFGEMRYLETGRNAANPSDNDLYNQVKPSAFGRIDRRTFLRTARHQDQRNAGSPAF